MAADFPPNLDDGELWLPSEIIADVGVCRRHHHHHRQGSAAAPPRYPPDLGYIEDLALQLAALGLLDRNHTLKSNPKLYPYPEQGFMPGRQISRYAPAEREAVSGFAYDGYRPPAARGVVSGFATSMYYPAARGTQQLNTGMPVQPQVETFGQGRARVLQRQEGHGLNWFVPPVRLRGSRRECGGTGVFLPRVGINEEVKKKPSMKGGEQQLLQSARNASMKKQGMMQLPFKPLSEMDLPPDWTY